MIGKVIRWYGPVHTGVGEKAHEMPGIFHGEHLAVVLNEYQWNNRSLDILKCEVMAKGIFQGLQIWLHKKQCEVVDDENALDALKYLRAVDREL